jgi:hypothetical protein
MIAKPTKKIMMCFLYWYFYKKTDKMWIYTYEVYIHDVGFKLKQTYDCHECDHDK